MSSVEYGWLPHCSRFETDNAGECTIIHAEASNLITGNFEALDLVNHNYFGGEINMTCSPGVAVAVILIIFAKIYII
jgi:hypothetical protein